MSDNNQTLLNRMLVAAVCEENVDEVRSLLSAGADVDLTYRPGKPLTGTGNFTLLYHTFHPEIIKLLVDYGANVNSWNCDYGSPLNCAIFLGKCVTIVRLLLRHGADANHPDPEGYTPLNRAIMNKYKNFTIIKELLKYSYNCCMDSRNISNSKFRKLPTPLENAIACSDKYPECILLIIKYTLIRKYVFEKLLAKHYLGMYVNFSFYSEMNFFQIKCISEILHMKYDFVMKNLSVLDCIRVANKKKIFPGIRILLDRAIIEKYPIYHDIILDSIKMGMERVYLLSQIQKCTSQITLNRNGKTQILNSDCLFDIAEYITNNDLLNLILAFFGCGDQSLDILEINKLTQPPIYPTEWKCHSNMLHKSREQRPVFVYINIF